MKIYCFINSGYPGWYYVAALAENGTYCGGHISSTIPWAKLDISSPRKREHYDKLFPEGYELEWVDDPSDERIEATYKLHLELVENIENEE